MKKRCTNFSIALAGDPCEVEEEVGSLFWIEFKTCLCHVFALLKLRLHLLLDLSSYDKGCFFCFGDIFNRISKTQSNNNESKHISVGAHWSFGVMHCLCHSIYICHGVSWQNVSQNVSLPQTFHRGWVSPEYDGSNSGYFTCTEKLLQI